MTERKGSSTSWFAPQITIITRAGPSGSQEPGTPPKFPSCRESGAQALGPSFAFADSLPGRWTESGAGGTQTGTLIRDAGFTNGDLAHRTTTLVLDFVSLEIPVHLGKISFSNPLLIVCFCLRLFYWGQR